MIIVFDKNLDAGITNIECGGLVADTFKWNIDGAASHIMDTNAFKIKIGAIDTTLSFSSFEAMNPYIQAFDTFNTLNNPVTDGIVTDPFYDKVPSGEIQSHTYVDTDVEQDLIGGN